MTSSAAESAEVERERKYELDEKEEVPRLVGAGQVTAQHGPVEHALDATYFDTRDLRLADAGITLRRRTGGDDAGWHLKLPKTADERVEIGLPLGENPLAVPRRFARLVRAYRLGGKLVPIAHLKSDRLEYGLADTSGRVIATMTDDHVTGEAGGDVAHIDHWRELEVELAPATEPGLLDEFDTALAEHGAKPSGWPSKLVRLLGNRPSSDGPLTSAKHADAGTVVLAYLRAQFDLLRRNDLGVRQDADDAVHQMRVAARRLRSALKTFGAVLDSSVTGGLGPELKWLAGELAQARDTEVMQARVSGQLDALPSEFVLGEVKRFLTRHFARETEEGRTRALKTLDSKRYLDLLKALDFLLTDPPRTRKADRPASRELRKAVRKTDRKLRRAEAKTRGLDDGPDLDLALHDVRKKAKQARYAADAARPVLGKKLGEWRKNVKKVQSTLGDHQDTVVTRRALYQWGITAFGEGDTTFTYGLLHGHNAAVAADLRRTFGRRWRKLPRQ